MRATQWVKTIGHCCKQQLQAEERPSLGAGSAKLSSVRLASGTHFQDSLPGASLTINAHAVPRPALARTRHDAFLVVYFEHRKSRKEEGVATHDLLGA